MIISDNCVKNVNFVNSDNPMGQLHCMYPEGCNSHWGGKPLSPIRLKPFKLLITKRFNHSFCIFQFIWGKEQNWGKN